MRVLFLLSFAGLVACSDELLNPVPDRGGAGGSGAGGGGAGGPDGGQGGVGGAACVPSIEICDTLDNDCDEQIDEDFEDGCDDPDADSDEDGLRDLWEVSGVDVDGDGAIDVDLPAMGANPLRKDAFLQVDWMEETGVNAHSDRFSDEAMRRVQQAYLDAPVENPDGSTGISLHLDAGPDSIMNPLTMETWGPLSLAKAIPHQDQLSLAGAPCSGATVLRDAHLPIARRGLFRFGAAVHSLAPAPKDPPCEGTIQFNGCAIGDAFAHSQGSSDPLLIQLGGFDPNVQDAVQESAHFMHELGHTFGLKHGGPNHTHRKPNNFSVMNYSYSYRGLFHEGAYGTLDYSRFDLPSLNENMLDETVGLGAPDELAGYGFIRYCGDQDVACLPDLSALTGELVEEPDATVAVDWNCNGMIDGELVAAEIHLTPPLSLVLNVENEWTALDFTAEGVIGGGAQTGANLAETDEPTVEDPLDRLSPLPYRVVVSGQGVRRDQPGPAMLSFALINRGTRPDVYVVSFRAGGLRVIEAPDSISLEPGAHRVVDVPVEVFANRHERARLAIKVVSSGNRKMAAEAETQIQ